MEKQFDRYGFAMGCSPPMSRFRTEFRWWFSPASWLFGISFVQWPWWGSLHLGPFELSWSRFRLTEIE